MRVFLRFIHSISLCVAVLACAALMGNVAIVSAGPVSFAQFSEAAPGGNLFNYLDNFAGPGGDAQFTALSVPVNFNYLLALLPLDLQGTQAAHLTMTSSTMDPVQTQAFGPIVVGSQPFLTAGTLPNSIAIIRDDPAAEGSGTRRNLLTVTFTAQLTGIVDGRTPQLSANSALGFNVTYTSDFLSFSSLDERDFSVTYSSWSSIPGGSGLEKSFNLLSPYFQTGSAAGAGTFSGTATVIPEPATATIAATGLISLAFGVVRRRRAAH